MINAEWADRASFAEVAEALGISTEDVLAATATGEERVFTLYTLPENTHDENPNVFSAQLVRDGSGILRLFGEPVEMPPLNDMLRQIGELGA